MFVKYKQTKKFQLEQLNPKKQNIFFEIKTPYSNWANEGFLKILKPEQSELPMA